MSSWPNNPMMVAAAAAPSGPAVRVHIKGVDPLGEPDRTVHHLGAGHRRVHVELIGIAFAGTNPATVRFAEPTLLAATTVSLIANTA